jgi:hypothetical protein
VDRAKEVLGTLETGHRVLPGGPPASPDPDQPTLFDVTPPPASGGAAGPPRSRTTDSRSPAPDPVREHLRSLDPDRMTPLEALNELARLRHQADDPDR